MWCVTQALNGMIGCGVPGDWTTHLIGHELTAYYGMDHAQSLVPVLPSVLHFYQKQKAKKLSQYGERVWKMGGDEDKKIECAIKKTIDFFRSVGIGVTFDEYNIKKDRKLFAEIAEKIISQEKMNIGENKNIGGKEIVEILMNVQE
jgi:NADP-dependent alcohol dehydrogenase